MSPLGEAQLNCVLSLDLISLPLTLSGFGLVAETLCSLQPGLRPVFSRSLSFSAC